MLHNVLHQHISAACPPDIRRIPHKPSYTLQKKTLNLLSSILCDSLPCHTNLISPKVLQADIVVPPAA